MTKIYQCWVFFFLLVACCDVGVGARCTSFADGLDCDTFDGDDDGSSIARSQKGDEALHIDTLIEASMARAAPVGKSSIAAKFSGIVGVHLGALLPETFKPTRSTATHQAGRCFEEIDILLDGLRDDASSAMDAASDMTIASWFFCPYAKRLVQLDPVVAASYTDDALTFSPFFVSHKGKRDNEKKKDDDDEWDIDVFLNGIFFEGESALCPEAKSDANGGGLGAVDACFYEISDNLEKKKISENDDGGSNNTGGDNDGGDGGIGQGSPRPSGGAPPSAFPGSRRAPAPATDPAIFPRNDGGYPAPAPAMGPSVFASGKVRSPLPSAMDPTMFPFAEESHPPAAPAMMDDPSSPSPSYDGARHPLLPSAMVDDPSPSHPFDDEDSFFEAVPQRKLRGAAMEDAADSIVLARAHRAVEADEAIEVEAFIISSKRKFEETKARLKEEEEEGDGRNFFARAVLGVVEDVAVYVDDLLVEILPDWANPISGLIIWGDECFVEADVMSVHPDWKARGFDIERYYSRDDGLIDRAYLFESDNDFDAHDGTGWFYCAAKNRFVQQHPMFVCPDNAITGPSFDLSSPLGEQDQFEDTSPVDAIVAAEYAVYEAEHMQLALYVPPEANLPAAVEARLARHVAELADEHAAIETVLESFLAYDEQERNRALQVELEASQVELERRIVTQMQQLLGGGSGDMQRQDEEEAPPLPPVCHDAEYYSFVPIDVTSTECGALPDVSRPPPMDACTPPETLHGNDEHASSRSDCLPYLQNVPVRFAPVSVEENASNFSYDTAASAYDYSPGSRFDPPGSRPQRVDGLLAFLMGVWTDARELAQGGTAVHMDRVIQASVARTRPAILSGMVAKLAEVVDTHFGAFLPDGVNPARYMAARRANKCFEDVDKVSEGLRAAAAAAAATSNAATDETESKATAPGGDTSSWFFCAHSDSLMQMDPAVLSSYANALKHSPFFAEGREEGEGKDKTQQDVSLAEHEQQPSRASGAASSRMVVVAEEGGEVDPTGVRGGNRNRAEPASAASAIFCRFLGVGCRTSAAPRATATHTTTTTTTTAPAPSPAPPSTAATTTAATGTVTIVTSSRDTVVTIGGGDAGQTATVTFSADTPTVGTHTTTIVYST